MSNIGVCLCQGKGEILTVNKNAEDMLGIPKSEIEEMSICDFGVEESLLNSAKVNDGLRRVCECQIVKKGGSMMPCSVSILAHCQNEKDTFLVWFKESA